MQKQRIGISAFCNFCPIIFLFWQVIYPFVFYNATTLLKTFLAFMKLSSQKDIIIFKYYPIPSSISPFVKSYLISRKSNISAFRAVPF